MTSNNQGPETGHVLVLGRDIRAFLSVIRSLGRASAIVHVGMAPFEDLALKSRYIKYIHEIPEYEEGSTDWLDTVTLLAQTYHFDLIVPTHDESAIPIQLFQDKLREHCGVYCLEQSVFDIAFDKIESSRLAESLGVRIPKQAPIVLSNLETGLPDGFNFPIVIKPSSSYSSEDLSTRREVVVARNRAQLNDILPKLEGWGVALIQDYFEGVGSGVEVLVNHGEIVYSFQHMRVHEPRAGGASSYRKSVYPIDDELYEATKALMGAMKYTGVAMVEFKINPQTGDWIFIEINGRFWGSLPLAIASGADFPRLLFELLTRGSVTPTPLPKNNVYCRNIKRDLYWAIDNLKDRFEENPSKYSVPLHVVLGEYLRLITFREHVDSFAIDDPAPALTEFREVVEMMFAKSRVVMSRRLRSLSPIHHWRRKRIHTATVGASRVMFLCSGNICRSPFAAIYAKEVLPPTVETYSSGFHDVENRKPPDQAIQSAAELGVDLSDHRSNRINSDLVMTLDVVFVFEEKQLTAFREEFPSYQNSLYYLGDLLTNSEFEIADPYGGGNDRFRQAYLSIVNAVDFLDSSERRI